jgi:carbon storage regulator
MLVLSRQRDQSIMIGDDIEITIVDVRGDKVRVGINAPRQVSVHRKEVYEAIRRETKTAATATSGRKATPITREKAGVKPRAKPRKPRPKPRPGSRTKPACVQACFIPQFNARSQPPASRLAILLNLDINSPPRYCPQPALEPQFGTPR